MARMLRKVIHISAEDSPNVQFARWQQQQGIEPTGDTILEGVLSWDDFCKRERLWDEVMKTIGLKGLFWEGMESLLFPPEWLNLSAKRAFQLSILERVRGPESKWCRQQGNNPFIRTAKAGGCDPGEGGDPQRLGTAWSIIDELGVLEIVEMRTTDTSQIAATTKALLRKWNLHSSRFVFDRGGGGKQIADQMRSEGYEVKTVGFGEPASPDPKLGRTRVKEKVEQREDKYAYPSKRCQMYHELRLALDPGLHPPGETFAIPAQYSKLRQELGPIPLLYDGKGRVKLPEKHRTGKRQAGQEKTLTEIIGHSPDVADSLVLAMHELIHGNEHKARAGGLRSREEMTPHEADEEYARARGWK